MWQLVLFAVYLMTSRLSCSDRLNELRDLVSPKGDVHWDSVGKLKIGGSHCTGSYVKTPFGAGGNEYVYVLTAAHCLYSQSSDRWKSGTPEMKFGKFICGAREYVDSIIHSSYPDKKASFGRDSCTWTDIAWIKYRRRNGCTPQNPLTLGVFPVSIKTKFSSGSYISAGYGTTDTLTLSNQESSRGLFLFPKQTFQGSSVPSPGDSGGSLIDPNRDNVVGIISAVLTRPGETQGHMCAIKLSFLSRLTLYRMAVNTAGRSKQSGTRGQSGTRRFLWNRRRADTTPTLPMFDHGTTIAVFLAAVAAVQCIALFAFLYYKNPGKSSSF